MFELGQAAVAETSIRKVGSSLFPTGVGVVIVEPDAIDRRGLEGLSKSRHAGPAIAGMRRADALPVIRRR